MLFAALAVAFATGVASVGVLVEGCAAAGVVAATVDVDSAIAGVS